MSIVKANRPISDATYGAIVAATVFLTLITALRAVMYFVANIDEQPASTVIAAASIFMLCLVVVAASPKASRANPDRRFYWLVGFAMAVNIGSHLFWLAS